MLFCVLVVIFFLLFLWTVPRKAWPAEHSQSTLIAQNQPVNTLPEIENWPVISERVAHGDLYNGSFLVREHQDPADSSKFGGTIWFINKEGELEVFLRINDLVRISSGMSLSPESRISIKLENGTWTEPVEDNKVKEGFGTSNGERALLFRILGNDGGAKHIRIFLTKDLKKIKN